MLFLMPMKPLTEPGSGVRVSDGVMFQGSLRRQAGISKRKERRAEFLPDGAAGLPK